MLFKRIVLIALAAVMLAGACVSCGSKPEAGAQTTSADTGVSAPAETEYIDTLGSRDFKGAKYVIMDANGQPTNHRNRPLEEKTGEILNDTIIERDAYISDRYNCEVTYLTDFDANGGCTALAQAYTAGDNICNIIITAVGDKALLPNLQAQNMLANLEDVPTIELTNPWWSRLMYENFRLNNKMYYTTGDISPASYIGQCVTLMNMKLLTDYGYNVDDVYQMVRDGKYTVDFLLELQELKQDVDGDGFLHTATDFFGYLGDSTGGKLTACAFAVGCDVSMSTLKDGKLSVDQLSDQHTVDVVEKVAKLVPHEKMTDRYEYIKVTFKEDRAISLMTYISSAKEFLRDMESDFMILPMPKYDEKQKEYRTLINGYCSCFISVPGNADMDFTGFVTEAMACKSYTTIRPCVYETILKAKVARDVQTTEMIDIVFDSLYLDFNAVYNFGKTTAVFSNSIYQGQAFASAIASAKTAAQKEIDDLAANW